jgi:predicted DCC family thiol-disulfide oxidoreductase YuxK
VTGAGSSTEPAWVLFDGRCGLCDALVRWLIARDRRAALRFAPLESEVAIGVRERHPDLPPADETLVLVEAPGTEAERVSVRSQALAGILARLGSPWRPVGRALRLVPAAVLDPLYGLVARRRDRWFGRLDACRIPTPAERARFLGPSDEFDASARSGTIPPP